MYTSGPAGEVPAGTASTTSWPAGPVGQRGASPSPRTSVTVSDSHGGLLCTTRTGADEVLQDGDSGHDCLSAQGVPLALDRAWVQVEFT